MSYDGTGNPSDVGSLHPAGSSFSRCNVQEQVCARVFLLHDQFRVQGADDGIAIRIVSHRDAFSIRCITDQRSGFGCDGGHVAGSRCPHDAGNIRRDRFRIETPVHSANGDVRRADETDCRESVYEGGANV